LQLVDSHEHLEIPFVRFNRPEHQTATLVPVCVRRKLKVLRQYGSRRNCRRFVGSPISEKRTPRHRGANRRGGHVRRGRSASHEMQDGRACVCRTAMAVLGSRSRVGVTKLERTREFAADHRRLNSENFVGGFEPRLSSSWTVCTPPVSASEEIEGRVPW
jgi:hypothetical protein